jgi:catechol 2,3-dioxygenase-like lactoylglutathione lyase family enzyme
MIPPPAEELGIDGNYQWLSPNRREHTQVLLLPSGNPMPALRPDHFTIVTDRLATTQAFYEAFGFTVGPRPAIRVPGLWMYLEGRPVLHIMESTRMPEPRRGVLDHMAFRAEGLPATLAALKAMGVGYRLRRIPAPIGDWQLFFDDPNGATVEFAFVSSELGENNEP